MGFLDSVFGKPELKQKKAPKAQQVEEMPVVEEQDISPEIIAVIAASVYAMMGTNQVVLRISRQSSAWSLAGRQKLMDVRQFV